MPLKYWYEAFLTATYLINCMPTQVIQGDTPLLLCLQRKAQLHLLAHIWLCLLAKSTVIQFPQITILFH
jgi:hypothetical protein